MKFKHKVTGIVEDVTNALLIPQYEKHSDTYECVDEIQDEPEVVEESEEVDEPEVVEEPKEPQKPKGAKK